MAKGQSARCVLGPDDTQTRIEAENGLPGRSPDTLAAKDAEGVRIL